MEGIYQRWDRLKLAEGRAREAIYHPGAQLRSLGNALRNQGSLYGW